MTRRVDIDKEFAVVVRKCGGLVLDDELGSVRPFANADYIFHESKVIAEMKRLHEDKSEDPEMKQKLGELWTSWCERGLVQGPTPPLIESKKVLPQCQHEMIRTMGDHLSPPALRTDPPPGAGYTRGFDTLGVRVPGFVISPFVKPKSVFNGVLDHTWILKFLGEKFGNGSYSDLVNNRAVGSVSAVFNQPAARPAPAIPSLVPYLAEDPAEGGYIPGTAPSAPPRTAKAPGNPSTGHKHSHPPRNSFPRAPNSPQHGNRQNREELKIGSHGFIGLCHLRISSRRHIARHSWRQLGEPLPVPSV